MPRRKDRSTSIKRIVRRVPSGDSRIRFKRESSEGRHHCALCFAALPGVQNTGSKTQKRPERKFGGMLCPTCTALVIKEATRVKEGVKTIEEVEIRLQKYVKAIA